MVDKIPISKAIILSSNFVDLKGFPNTSINSKRSLSDVERFMTKVEMLHSLSKSMATMASCFASAFKIWDAFLISTVEINNEQKKKININNLKVVKY